jgi:hypothetical protein
LADTWQTRDYRGRNVMFTEASRDHLLQRRRDLTTILSDIREVISSPAVVTRDLKYPRRECHYGFTSSPPGMIKVVVQYRPVPPQGRWVGEVVTAYPLGEPDPREEVLTS